MLEGLPDVLAHLELAVLAMKGPAAKSTAREVGARAAAAMRASVPVRTGELLGDIVDHDTEDADGVGHEIVIEDDHAVFVEFGTSNMAEQPFLRPAMHTAESELPNVARSTYQRLVPFLH